jgi:hypothetical protein
MASALPDGAALPPSLPSPSLRSGELAKLGNQGKWNERWVRRWFNLTTEPALLAWFYDEKMSRKAGELDLAEPGVEIIPYSSGARGHSWPPSASRFTVKTLARTYVFGTISRNADDKQEWLRGLAVVCGLPTEEDCDIPPPGGSLYLSASSSPFELSATAPPPPPPSSSSSSSSSSGAAADDPHPPSSPSPSAPAPAPNNPSSTTTKKRPSFFSMGKKSSKQGASSSMMLTGSSADFGARQGWLQTRQVAYGMGGWKKRYVVLRNGSMTVYRDASMSVLKVSE